MTAVDTLIHWKMRVEFQARRGTYYTAVTDYRRSIVGLGRRADKYGVSMSAPDHYFQRVCARILSSSAAQVYRTMSNIIACGTV